MRKRQSLLVSIVLDLLVDQIIEFCVPKRHIRLAVPLHLFLEVLDVLIRRTQCAELASSVWMKTDCIHIIQSAKLRAFAHPRSRRRAEIAGQAESGNLRGGVRRPDCRMSFFQIVHIHIRRQIEIRLVGHLIDGNAPFEMLYRLVNVVAVKVSRRQQYMIADRCHAVRRIILHALRKRIHPERPTLTHPRFVVLNKTVADHRKESYVVLRIQRHLTVKVTEIKLPARPFDGRPVNPAHTAVMVAQNTTADP